MSYANMIMYGAVLPNYKSKKNRDKAEDKQEVIKVDDPQNREKVRQIFDEFD